MKVQASDFSLDDPLRKAPQHYKAMLENNRIRVLEYRSKPGEKSALHSHPDCVVYSFSPAILLITSAFGENEEVALKTGEVIWRNETTHALQNIGSTEAHLLVIELKAPIEPVPLV